MGSYSGGYTSPNMGSNYGYPTYTSPLRITHEPPSAPHTAMALLADSAPALALAGHVQEVAEWRESRCTGRVHWPCDLSLKPQSPKAYLGFRV